MLCLSQSGDAMAAMARIVSDDPPSMRRLRPDLPKALDDVVLRGLARERNEFAARVSGQALHSESEAT